MAKHFSSLGANLILSSRSLDNLQRVRDGCEASQPGSILLLPLDITTEYETIEAETEKAFHCFPRGIDYIVHNVGVSQHAIVEELSMPSAKALLELNLSGPIAVARASLPHMVRQGREGRHVVIASMAAVVPSPGQSVYCAAKSGLRSYFKTLSCEMSTKGIGATICCPGPLDTSTQITRATEGEGEGITTDTRKPRMVYGADGLIAQHVSEKSSKKRLPATKAAELIATAAYHRVDECWIAQHPVLLMGYVSQHLPGLSMTILKKIGANRALQLRDGSGTGYEVKSMFLK